jgi:hypothetical protein
MIAGARPRAQRNEAQIVRCMSEAGFVVYNRKDKRFRKWPLLTKFPIWNFVNNFDVK